MQLVTCRIGKQLFGVDILMVREVNRVLDITPIPGEKPHIRGLINLRGQIVTIFDARVRLGIPKGEFTENSHNIIIKGGAELRVAGVDADQARALTDPSGLLVDSIGDVVVADDQDVEPPPANVGTVDAAFLQGVLQKDDALIAILDVPRMLAPD